MEKIMPIENMPTSGNNCDESIREMREKYNNKKEKNQIKSGKLWKYKANKYAGCGGLVIITFEWWGEVWGFTTKCDHSGRGVNK